MRNLRTVMLVAVVAATALASLAGFFLGGPPTRLLVDAGLATALAVIIGLMMSPTMGRIDALVEALRALARGDKHQRVEPDQFAGLADVARALNEVAASMTEHEDPNLGPVKSQPRPGARAKPPTQSRPKDRGPDDPRAVPEPDLSDHPELGPVRVHKKGDGNGHTSSPPAPATTTKAHAAASAASAASDKRARPESGAERPERAAPSNDTSIDEKPRSDIRSSSAPPAGASSSSSSSSSSGAPASASASGSASGASGAGASGASGSGSGAPELAQIPSRDELEVLFQEFVAAKKSHDEAVADLDFDAFAQTIQGECERLIAAHHCKGVRFEVTMQDGEVSLRPRLLR